MVKNPKRRGFVARLTALLVLPFAAPWLARAQSEPVDVLVQKVTGGAAVRRGRVNLEIPVLAENGNSVSLKVSVDSPMSASDFVKSIHLYAEKNPRPNIANFYLNPRGGRAQISTRVRLAGTQRVLAVAALSDGSFWSGTADVSVTNSSCYDGS
jgi:sulfur-oxidizing protein SoxY